MDWGRFFQSPIVSSRGFTSGVKLHRVRMSVNSIWYAAYYTEFHRVVGWNVLIVPHSTAQSINIG